jgi:hypothetical protein
MFESGVGHDGQGWHIGEAFPDEAEHASRVFAAGMVNDKRDRIIQARNKALHFLK